MSIDEPVEKDEVTINLNPEDILKMLNDLGRIFCLLISFLPGEEFSFPMEVEGACTLTFTVKKD